ncbi:MAG: Fe-S oxidoreductase [Rhodospirillaceae bacterium]|nr:Fe-S oxidoreductase [Rhodospirillaceae bacterium]|tara:strand:+ start:4956 stop:5720 length:765 start_codon:yes stop_codon:yes gene_type:complete
MKNNRVALFITCLVDLFRPTVGFASIKLLEEAGCEVVVPRQQTCCGQPAYNTGDRADTISIAKQVIVEFEDYDYIIVPSGSCAGMISKHYPALFSQDSNWLDRANRLSKKTYELISFLTDIMGVDSVDSEFQGTVTYHDACSGLRELSIHDQPRRLLSSIDGLHLRELDDANVCCGFGGTFCVKYADISNRMVETKAEQVIATGADTLLAGDLGCLLNMAGKLQRDGVELNVRHVAEVLAGMADKPAIGVPSKD